jgi:hypothetical protein
MGGVRGVEGRVRGGEVDFTPVFLLYCMTRRAVYVLCHTYTHAAQCSLCLTFSSLSPPLPPFFSPPPFTPEPQQEHGIDEGIGQGLHRRCGGNRGCRPSPGPYSDDRRALSRQRGGECEGWIGGEGGYVLRRGGGEEGRGEGRQCILSPLSPSLPVICSPIPHTVYVFTNPLCISLLSLLPPLLSQEYGCTALILAAFNGKPRIVDILIKADPSGDHLNMKVG